MLEEMTGYAKDDKNMGVASQPPPSLLLIFARLALEMENTTIGLVYIRLILMPRI